MVPSPKRMTRSRTRNQHPTGDVNGGVGFVETPVVVPTKARSALPRTPHPRSGRLGVAQPLGDVTNKPVEEAAAADKAPIPAVPKPSSQAKVPAAAAISDHDRLAEALEQLFQKQEAASAVVSHEEQEACAMEHEGTFSIAMMSPEFDVSPAVGKTPAPTPEDAVDNMPNTPAVSTPQAAAPVMESMRMRSVVVKLERPVENAFIEAAEEQVDAGIVAEQLTKNELRLQNIRRLLHSDVDSEAEDEFFPAEEAVDDDEACDDADAGDVDQYECNEDFDCNELCAAVESLNVAGEGAEPLRGLPVPTGSHIRFDEDDAGNTVVVESPRNGKVLLRGMPMASGKHIRY